MASSPLTPPHDHDHGHDHGHDHHHSHPHTHDHGHEGAARSPVPSLPHGAGVGKTLHLDCFSGIAGDMLVAALLDLGVPREPIDHALESIPLRGYKLEIGTRVQSGIIATRFHVDVVEAQPERRFRDIRVMLCEGGLLDGVRTRALAAFAALAEAEGRVHRMPPDDVQFHEVGSVDAIVDIVAASAALEWLGARVTCAPLPMGRGFVRAAHGVLPIPAPAVVEILRGAPTIDAPVDVELVTPTGATLARSNAQEFVRWPAMRPIASGFGAGTRTIPNRPNLLRVVLGTPDDLSLEPGRGHSHAVVEANVDDVTGQVCATVADALLRDGALDAWVTPIGMKKGRPAVTISALTRATDRERVGRRLLEESGSLGVRWHGVDRQERPRRTESVVTAYGTVPVKVGDGDGIAPTAQPEFDVCRELAGRSGVPVRVVQAAALAAWWTRAAAEVDTPNT
jgi:uncharacterized protein (TIGR00299 family) protein